MLGDAILKYTRKIGHIRLIDQDSRRLHVYWGNADHDTVFREPKTRLEYWIRARFHASRYDAFRKGN